VLRLRPPACPRRTARRAPLISRPTRRSAAGSAGRRLAARRPIIGADHVAAFIAGIVRGAPADIRVAIRIGRVNGLPRLLTFVDGRLYNVASIEVEDGRIRRIFIVLNPDKLPEPVARTDAS